jgi:hypothetical protein
MSRVVIVHAAEDALPAKALAEKLRHARLEVTLELPPGQALRAAVAAASVTLALWSPRSSGQPSLAEEAMYAHGRSTVIHATMQDATLPPGFEEDIAINLTGWRGENDFPAWRELLKLITDTAGVPDFEPVAPAGSGFFTAPASPAPASPAPAMQSSAQAPRAEPAPFPRGPAPVEPAASSKRTLIIAAAAAAAVIIGGGGYFAMSQNQGAAEAGAAWEDVDYSNARELRAFLAANPGAYRDEAEQKLAELEERSFEAASDADSIEALQEFVAVFPDSEHALAARGRIAELQTVAATPPAPEASPEMLAPPMEGVAPDPDLVPPGTTPQASGDNPVDLRPRADEGGPVPLSPNGPNN